MDAAADRGEARRLARALLPDGALEFAARVTERVLHAVPELAPAGDPRGIALVHESTDQNIGAMFSTLAFGVTAAVADAPVGTKELLGNLQRMGSDVTHLLHAYRVGHQLLWQMWSEYVCAHICDAESIPGVLEYSSAHMFEFIDQTCQQITSAPGAYSRDIDIDMTDPGDRSLVIRHLLSAHPMNVTAASANLQYDLNNHHLGLVAYPLTAGADVRAQLEKVLAAAGAPAVAVPGPDRSWWAWLGWPTTPTGGQVELLVSVSVTGVIVSVGSIDRGREGFRQSHRHALQALWVARLGPHPQPRVVAHRDIEPLALLCNDPVEARSFSAARLGGLARRDDTGRRLRATVRALLACGNNRGRAARQLHVHHKTIAYRLAQAEDLLDRPLTEDPFSLYAALLIDEALHGP